MSCTSGRANPRKLVKIDVPILDYDTYFFPFDVLGLFEKIANGSVQEGSITTRNCFQVRFMVAMISCWLAVKIFFFLFEAKSHLSSFNGTSSLSAIVVVASSEISKGLYSAIKPP